MVLKNGLLVSADFLGAMLYVYLKIHKNPPLSNFSFAQLCLSTWVGSRASSWVIEQFCCCQRPLCQVQIKPYLALAQIVSAQDTM